MIVLVATKCLQKLRHGYAAVAIGQGLEVLFEFEYLLFSDGHSLDNHHFQRLSVEALGKSW